MGKRSGDTDRRARNVRRWKVAGLVSIMGLSVLIVGASMFWKSQLDDVADDVPRLEELMDQVLLEPTKIVSSDGKVLFTLASEYRKPIPMDQMPTHVINATVAAEDRRFYDHDGVDLTALGRAGYVFVKQGEATQGGSTLTMQIAKLVFSDRERTVKRKVRDMALATMIEREYSKDQILRIYLNYVYYGSGAHGIGAAADVYFDKSVDELTIAEAAMLARCVRRPSSVNPFRNLDASITNRNVVLKVMKEEGMISEAEYQEGIAEPVALAEEPETGVANRKLSPYFVDWVIGEVVESLPDVDLYKGGYTVYTTLNYDLDQYAKSVVNETVDSHSRQRVTTGAFMLMDKDGRVLAMVGGKDYGRNQFNVVTQGKRQPGSSFKAFVYATALQYGAIGLDSLISNERATYRIGNQTYQPRNSNNSYGGRVNLVTAMEYSINVPAVRTIDDIGPETVANTVRSKFGFTSEIAPVLSLALGSSAVSPYEMAQGFSVFQSGGHRIKPFGVEKVIAPDGKPVGVFGPRITRDVIKQSAATTMDNLLRGAVQRGTGNKARGVTNARGKTGTTNDFKDAWFVGYTDRYLGVAWVGNEVRNPEGSATRWSYNPMARVYGGDVCAPMWSKIVKRAQRDLGEKARQFPPLYMRTRVASEEEDEDDPLGVTETDIGDTVISPEDFDRGFATESGRFPTETPALGSGSEAPDGEVPEDFPFHQGLQGRG